MQKIPKKQILDHPKEEKKCARFSENPQCKREAFVSGRISVYQSERNVTASGPEGWWLMMVC